LAPSGALGTTRSTIISIKPSHRGSLARTVSANANSRAARVIHVRFFTDVSVLLELMLHRTISNPRWTESTCSDSPSRAVFMCKVSRPSCPDYRRFQTNFLPFLKFPKTSCAEPPRGGQKRLRRRNQLLLDPVIFFAGLSDFTVPVVIILAPESLAYSTITRIFAAQQIACFRTYADIAIGRFCTTWLGVGPQEALPKVR
jgi:hypothetical protein